MFFRHCHVGGRIVSLDSTRPDWWTNPNLVPSELQIHRFLPSIIHQTHVLSNYTLTECVGFFLCEHLTNVSPPTKKSSFHVIPTFKSRLKRPTFSPGHSKGLKLLGTFVQNRIQLRRNAFFWTRVRNTLVVTRPGKSPEVSRFNCLLQHK